MDIIEALEMWRDMGNSTKSYNKDNNYIIEFIENNEVVGHIITYPGQGIKWEYPQSLVDNNLTCLNLLTKE